MVLLKRCGDVVSSGAKEPECSGSEGSQVIAAGRNGLAWTAYASEKLGLEWEQYACPNLPFGRVLLSASPIPTPRNVHPSVVIFAARSFFPECRGRAETSGSGQTPNVIVTAQA
ncbi:hypothetical protein NP493_1154g00037 [Ridgeia piscesae]|uniref:Uncharacterized protein n=1 Tax=Ridgeia piscesae TaxID=27915 RepID=A0AAD9KFQ5_RIDPI|nr:hypothetical protein NP493_1154g00037 [Ridgeia piscesae]